MPSEPVTGVREADGEAWCVDDLDVEQAAREQAAAARNKRRRLLEDAEAASGGAMAGYGIFEKRAPRPPAPPRPKPPPGEGRPRSSTPPVRKKKRLAPASNNCLACTKGKHCAHTCGVRGKAAMAALEAERLKALGLEPPDPNSKPADPAAAAAADGGGGTSTEAAAAAAAAAAAE